MPAVRLLLGSAKTKTILCGGCGSFKRLLAATTMNTRAVQRDGDASVTWGRAAHKPAKTTPAGAEAAQLKGFTNMFPLALPPPAHPGACRLSNKAKTQAWTRSYIAALRRIDSSIVKDADAHVQPKPGFWDLF